MALDAATEDALDRALVRLQPFAAEYDDGLSNHGPMAAEALAWLNPRADVEQWANAYAARLQRARPLGRPLDAESRRAARGQPERLDDLRATLLAEHDAERGFDLDEVLARHWSDLVDGYAAAAFHAPIRVGHAVRALERRDSAPRRRELLEALAYWYASYQSVPGPAAAEDATQPALEGLLGIEAGLAALPRLSPAHAAAAPRLISARIALTAHIEGFAEAAAQLRFPEAMSPSTALSALARICAAASIDHPKARFTFLHGVTGTAALRTLSRHLDGAGVRAGLTSVVRAAAAVWATHHRPDEASPPADLPRASPASLRTVAARSTDEHTIKFTEALLAEHGLAPAPAPELLDAARAWLATTGELRP